MTFNRNTYELTFNNERNEHEYTINGKVVPSVTQILKRTGLTRGTEYYTEAGRRRGTYVHGMIVAYELHILDETILPEAARAYLDVWTLCKAQMGIRQTILTEYAIGHPRYCYAGTLDLLCLVGKVEYPTLIDLKTGTPQPADALQTMLYSLCLEVNPDVEAWQNPHRAAIYLSPERYIFEAHEDWMDDRDDALSAVRMYHYKKRHNLLEVEL